MRCAQYQSGMGMSGDGFQNLVCLLYREAGIFFQQSCSVIKRNVERSNGLRNAVQLIIQESPKTGTTL